MEIKNATTELWDIMEEVFDPEIPVLSVVDLGIIRSIKINEGVVHVQITPTYTGCPAMQLIEMNIKAALEQQGYIAHIETVLSPSWTTDWISEKGKIKLKEYGIAPPNQKAKLRIEAFSEFHVIHCPRCDSDQTEIISEFGSTACKSLYKCLDCKEPFDYFKCH